MERYVCTPGGVQVDKVVLKIVLTTTNLASFPFIIFEFPFYISHTLMVAHKQQVSPSFFLPQAENVFAGIKFEHCIHRFSSNRL